MPATTHKQLENYMAKVLRTVVNETTDECLSKLQDFIIDDVYEYDYYPNKFYYKGDGEATLQFLESFIQKRARKSMLNVVGKIVQDINIMKVNPETDLHYNYALGGDIRKDLAEYLNRPEFGHKTRGQYWDNFSEWLDKNVYKILDKNLKKWGVV